MVNIRLRDGLVVHYRTYGCGPTVVLLHPVAMNSTFWNGLIAALGERYRFVAIDLRGHGESEVPRAPFTLDALADDVAEVLAYSCPRPTAVIGLSLGGMIAQFLALRHPQRVAGLVLANTRFQMDPQHVERLEARALRAEEQGMAGALEETIQRWFTPEFIRYQPGAIKKFSRILLAADPTVNAMTWRAMKGLDNTSALTEIRVPTLVLHGADDQASPLSGALGMAERIPNAAFVELAHAGHMSVIEQPVRFAAVVDSFLSKVFAVSA